jgi:hypothetical protein
LARRAGRAALLGAPAPNSQGSAEGLLARVQDVTRNKPVAKTACQVPEPGEVIRTNCRAGFDLDGYDAAVGCLDDGVDFELVLGPVVDEAGGVPAA